MIWVLLLMAGTSYSLELNVYPYTFDSEVACNLTGQTIEQIPYQRIDFIGCIPYSENSMELIDVLEGMQQ